jgi:hypothetical protein
MTRLRALLAWHNAEGLKDLLRLSDLPVLTTFVRKLMTKRAIHTLSAKQAVGACAPLMGMPPGRTNTSISLEDSTKEWC